jgi:hypothetical protein
MSLHSSERKGNPSFGPQSSGPARTSNADVESAPEPFPPVRVNVDGIPATMRPYAQFFPWRWCLNDDGHPTKVPKWFEKNLETGKFETYSIRANLPENWHPFEEVAGLVEANQKALRPFLGLAFRFAPSDPFAFIDLDHCRNRDTGEVESWALEIVRRLDSYTEISPSGTGMKIIIRGTKPGPRCRNRNRPHSPEIYDHTQFSTLTGNRLSLPGLELPADVQDRQAELEALYAETFPEETGAGQERKARAAGGPVPPARAADVSDEWVIGRLAERPYRHGPNKSEDDLRLCNLIAYYVGPDPARIEHILFAAPARRAKWARKDYVARTIDRVIEYQAARGFYADLRADLGDIGPAEPADVEALLGRGRDRGRPAAGCTCGLPHGPAGPWVPIVLPPAAGPGPLLAALSQPPTPEEAAAAAEAERVAKVARKAATADRPPPRTCGYLLGMFHAGTGKYRACRVLCGRSGCATCGPKKKEQSKRHLREVITTVLVLGGPPGARRSRPDAAYVARVRDDHRTSRRIAKHVVDRNGGDFVRIKYTPGWQLVVATVPLQPRDEAECMSPLDAAAEAVRTIEGMILYGDSKKPIFTSRGWKLPPRAPAGWSALGGFPPGSREVEVVEAMEAEAAGRVEVREKYTPLPFMPWLAECPIPPAAEDQEEMTPGERARYHHSRVSDRVRGVLVDDSALDYRIDQLFGVPAGP